MANQNPVEPAINIPAPPPRNIGPAGQKDSNHAMREYLGDASGDRVNAIGLTGTDMARKLRIAAQLQGFGPGEPAGGRAGRA